MRDVVYDTLERVLGGNRSVGWARRRSKRPQHQLRGAAAIGRLDDAADSWAYTSRGYLIASRSDTSGGSSSGSRRTSRRSPDPVSPVSEPWVSPACSRPSSPADAELAARPQASPQKHVVYCPSSPTQQQPLWVQRYMFETEGMVSAVTLEKLVARWELERADPEAAAREAKARKERSPVAMEKRPKQRLADRRRAWVARKAALEQEQAAARQREAEQLARERDLAALQEQALARAAVVAKQAEAEAAERQRRTAEAARAAEHRAKLVVTAATRIQAVWRGCHQRKQHHTRLQTPIRLISLLGGPGSGKSTLCERLLADESLAECGVRLCHLSTGQLLRQAVQRRSHPQHAMIAVLMADGEPVPDPIVADVLCAEVKRFRYRCALEQQEQEEVNNVALLDGFPFNAAQAQMLPEPFSIVFKCECPAETMVQRVLSRAEATGRSDDAEGTAWTIIRQFERQTLPVLSGMDEEGLVSVVDCGEGSSVEESAAAVIAQLRRACRL